MVCIGNRARLRGITALAARVGGMKYREIAEAFGVSIERARQMVHWGDIQFFHVTVNGRGGSEAIREYRI